MSASENRYGSMNSHLTHLLRNGVSSLILALARHLRDQQPLVLEDRRQLGFSESLITVSAISCQPSLPHELARVVLFEQLFRAACILNNKEYHH